MTKKLYTLDNCSEWLSQKATRKNPTRKESTPKKKGKKNVKKGGKKK